MASVFDGLPDIFTGVFGESVDYTPVGGVLRRINAIWIETPISIAFDNVTTDEGKIELHIPVATLTPGEGDTARRVSDGKSCKVTTPILPDGRGMIVCALELV